MIITTPKEFSFKEILHFLTRSPKELLHVVEGNSVYKLLKLNNSQLLFKMLENENGIELIFLNQKPTPDEKDQVVEYVKEWFDLDKDLKPFYSLAKKDKHLGPLVENHFGYRIVGQPDLYESLIWAVLGQQINLAFVYTLKQRFVEVYGESMVFSGRPYFLFPAADSVVDVKPEDLLELQFSNQKARYVIEISRAFVDGVISKEKLKDLTLEEAKEKLMNIKGVGNWTANYALMKTFRYPDAFPLEDAGVKNAVRKCLKLDRAPTLNEIQKFFKKYSGWEAYATLYLWRSL